MVNCTAIVAMDAERGIGLRNALPWHLPEDLAHFKRVTSGQSLIMGRNTYESIGRPLPNRQNIVISRNPEWRADGVQIADSPEHALALVERPQAFIIGGAQIFAQMLAACERLIVTDIHATFDCDRFFPEIDFSVWRELDRQPVLHAANGLEFAIVTYQRHTD